MATTPDRRFPGSTGWILLLPIAIGSAWCAAQGFEGLYGQDPHDYYQRALAWSVWLKGGQLPAPALHPPAYPFIGALLGAIVGDLLALRLVSVLSLVGILLVVRRRLQAMSTDSRVVDAFVLLAISASPFMLRHALFVMSDMLCICLLMVLYQEALRFRADGVAVRMLTITLCAGAALITRAAAAPVVAVVLIHMGITLFRKRRWELAVMSALAGTLGWWILHFTGRTDGLHWQHPWLAQWSFTHFFQRDFSTLDGVAHYALPNLLNAMKVFVHAGFLLIGAPLLFFVRRSDLYRPGVQLAASMTLMYLLFIAGIPFQNDRFLLPLQPLIALALFPAFERAFAAMEGAGRWRMAALVAIAAVQMVLFAYSLRTFVRMARTERELAALVKSYPQRPLYQFSLGPALATYDAPGTIIDLWSERIDHFEPGALLLVQPESLEKQWHGLHPAENWQRAMAQGVDTLVARPDGWRLYRIR